MFKKPIEDPFRSKISFGFSLSGLVEQSWTVSVTESKDQTETSGKSCIRLMIDAAEEVVVIL